MGRRTWHSHHIGTPILNSLSELTRCVWEDSRALDEELANEVKRQNLSEYFQDGFLVLKASPDNITCGYQLC